ncbi:hypothetical protein GLS_c16340 [Gluconobacter oxydans DSM 3504]|uniref:Uncharacterized protein n=1 Tax=Gluconobacter oxydans DSM 3504 TaxID=1288313 RepID=A0A067Z4W4_GLUOY|nr:hypothetical protein GLS_c16340 [Gluconobacter oxydans DSM 3504]
MILGLRKNMIRHETALRKGFWCFPQKTLLPCSTAQAGKCCLTSLRGWIAAKGRNGSCYHRWISYPGHSSRSIPENSEQR